MKSNLEFQADRIGIVLAVRKVPARVARGTVTPHRVNLQVVSVGGAKVSRIQRLSEQIATALDASPPPLG
ncbi:MAG: retroviral-like aspartic protease family protein [Anaerolineae bacterium]|nr:retroviral-like aspartic protease family protein [Anaerolineae bacterium]